MDASPDVLLVDDGELDDVERTLEALGVPAERVRGGGARDLRAPGRLLIATPRRANAINATPGAPAPIRIAVVSEDSNALREGLRAAGFDWLVRTPVHPQMLRLLVLRALYQGEERRRHERVLVGSETAVWSGLQARQAVLVDLSERGGRVVGVPGLQRDARVVLAIPLPDPDGQPLELEARVVRISEESTPAGPTPSAAVVFEGRVSVAERSRLAGVLDAWRKEATTGPTDAEKLAPSVPVQVAVPEADAPERRQDARRPYRHSIQAYDQGTTRVLIGRDLSAGGMRIEPTEELGLGDRMVIAIYAPDREEPLKVRARVARDDAAHGLALQFDEVPRVVANELEKLVACLPDVEPLQAGERAALGSILSEVLEREPGKAE
ncbi:MAG: PilZ domain-containing protein [Proteobacteria bacterium]|nr:PilZ domain-containing protein [Pseudomonadota bacterium]